VTHKTRAVAARLFLGGFLIGSPLLAGCGGGGSSSQTDHFAEGASITKQAHVVAETAVFPGSTQPRTIYLLRDASGQTYSPLSDLGPAFQKDGLNVQFSATVVDNGVGVVDGTGGVYITITSIHAL